MATRRSRATISVSAERGVFMISVAAELAEMHPQTLRMYEARGLVEPKRSPKGTRLYSQTDVERLRRIQRMTAAGSCPTAAPGGISTATGTPCFVIVIRSPLATSSRSRGRWVLAS